MMDYILFKNIDDKYLTLKDCIEENQTEEEKAAAEEEKKEENSEEKEPKKTTIFYVTDPIQQSQYINMFRKEGKDAVILRHNIDSAFISHLERLKETIQFKRIDADLTEEFTTEETADENVAKKLKELFQKELKKENLDVRVENLKNEEISAMITLSEESRRMQEMMKMYNMYGMDSSMLQGQETLVLNANHPLVKYLVEKEEAENAPIICEQLYDLAMLSHKQLSPEEMTKFVERSNKIMLMLTK